MAEDWLADVRKYDANADEGAVAGIVRYCGIALRNRDSSMVSMSDPKETARVRENYLKKKLGRTEDDATLDRAIADVGERMKGDRTKNRVTVYYLLADGFGQLDRFGGGAQTATAKPTRTRAAKVGGTAGTVAAAAATAGAGSLAGTGAARTRATKAAPVMSTPAASDPVVPIRPAPVDRMAETRTGAPLAASARSFAEAAPREKAGFIGFGLIAAGAMLAIVLFAAVVGGLTKRGAAQEPPAAPPADFSHPLPTTAAPITASAGAPTATPAAAVPQGAGVVAAERDARPMLSVYFDTAKADVTPDFAATAAPLLGYLRDHPAARAAVSGFNDPSGNAAANAALSKSRAQSVQAALVAAGVPAARIDLVKPADATSTGVTPAEARRVEVTATGG